jgi:hypothetical protein
MADCVWRMDWAEIMGELRGVLLRKILVLVPVCLTHRGGIDMLKSLPD